MYVCIHVCVLHVQVRINSEMGYLPVDYNDTIEMNRTTTCLICSVYSTIIMEAWNRKEGNKRLNVLLFPKLKL